MKNIYSYSLIKLENYFSDLGDKKFKATQVYEWLYKSRVQSFDEMKNVKKETIEQLKSDFNMKHLEIIASSADHDASKYLFKLEDDNKIEAVLMRHDYGNSLCVSTQVGCNMNCTFCESGRLKKVRNLEVAEMVLQVLAVEADLKIRVSHVVLMGIGEPFDNYDNVMDFLDIINRPKGIDIGARHITISTSGVIPKIIEFTSRKMQVNLAISLHAPNDELRNQLMPINKAYGLTSLMEAIKEYIKVTNRRITFEYIMLKDINDTEECAYQLSKLLKGINCYVNLIPYNETSHISYHKSDNEQVMHFYDILKKQKINVTVRKEFGSKLMAACGQLRSNYEETK